MTERIYPDDGVEGELMHERWVGVDRDSAVHRNTTAALVDHAVNSTLDEANVTPEAARVIKSILGNDTNSALAKAYFHGKADPGTSRVPFGVSRKLLTIPYVLRDEQAAMLTTYAPDFDLRILSRESHDHPMAAACRSVDRALVEAKLPPGASVSHIGASVVPLVTSGKLGRGNHACCPLIDRKDMARHVLVNLRLRKIANDVKQTLVVRDAAQGYLDKRPAYVCNKVAQECEYRTPVLTAIHVYDVPMADWAAIMDRKGGQLLEGCVLFPKRLFDLSSGDMPIAGARYEVDAQANIFRMGFVGSPSWWYEHKLSEYLKYGVDQVLCAGKATYSYKVTERRGDTLFFRILKVSAKAKPNFQQHYQVPGVEMVRVNGFAVSQHAVRTLANSRCTYLFPRVLWEDMLCHAKECVERGVLSHEKLFNYYRTVAPRQSINAVVVSGGVVVEEMAQLVPLVVHVAFFAFLEVRKVAVESEAAIESVMDERRKQKEFTFYKVFAAFGQGLLSTLKLTIAPVAWIVTMVDKGLESLAILRSFDWALEPVIQTVSAKLVLSHCFSDGSDVVADFSAEYSEEAPADMARTALMHADTAHFVMEILGDSMPEDWKKTVRKAVEPVGEAAGGAVASQSRGLSRTVPDKDYVDVGTVETVDVTAEEVARRQQSIMEAMAECDAEAKKSEADCADQYRDLMVGGAPCVKKTLLYREPYHNPEFWRVTSGVLQDGLSGTRVDDFQHAVVYCPVPVGGSRLIQVVEEEYKGLSQGEYVERIYRKLANSTYTGWVYTNDSLLIHNGPAVTEALEMALTLPLDFVMILNQGPPGCGKTTKIVDRAVPSDVVLVPVRKAARETADRLRAKSPEMARVVKERVKTVDSYLVNVLRNRSIKALKPDRLLADEAFMTREGRWLAAAALLGVSVVEAFGDEKQIPHVPRAECPSGFVRMQFSVVSEEFLSHRCPPQLVACWGGVYDWKVRSTSSVEGVVKRVNSTVGMEIPPGCVMMGMYQADKKTLRDKYGRLGNKVQIMTVHESEGNTYENVWLHRFDLRKRTDKFSLYDKPDYALVAMSRSTHSFVYVSQDLGDAVSAFMRLGEDPRRVTAARDVATAGQSIEFL